MPAVLKGLAETCLQCARASYKLLLDSWIDGSFATFDYFSTQYLFSAATILAVAGPLGSPQQVEDRDNFETAVGILDQLNKNGNFAAKDYCAHLSAVKDSLAHFQARTEAAATATSVRRNSGDRADQADLGITSTDMALSDPFLLEFLAQPDLDVGFIDPSIYDGSPYDPNWPLPPAAPSLPGDGMSWQG